MVEGDKWEMYIPSDLAYGEGGAGPAQTTTPLTTTMTTTMAATMATTMATTRLQDQSFDKGCFPLPPAIKARSLRQRDKGKQVIAKGRRSRPFDSALACTHWVAGSPPKIQGGDALVFTMELIKIKGEKVEANRCGKAGRARGRARGMAKGMAQGMAKGMAKRRLRHTRPVAAPTLMALPVWRCALQVRRGGGGALRLRPAGDQVHPKDPGRRHPRTASRGAHTHTHHL